MANNSEKPHTIQGDLRNLPSAIAPLTKMRHWLLWQWEKPKGKEDSDKWTKVPYQPNGRKAESNNPATWNPYDVVVSVYEERDGIGFCLTETNIVAMDIDDCRDPATGAIDLWAQKLVDDSRSYTEITVSGTGLRIIGRGTGPKLHRKQQAVNGVTLETYRRATRYIVITGNQLPGTPSVLADIDPVIDITVIQLDAKNNTKQETYTGSTSSTGSAEIPPTLAVLLHIPNKGPGVPHGGYPSRSELTFAFITAAMLRRVKISDEAIIAACLNDNYNGNAIREHCRDEGERSYVLRQVEHARSKIQEKSKKEQQPQPGELDVIRLSDIEAKRYNWLWKPRIARGKLTLLVGMPDVSKSTCALDLTARITRNSVLPDGGECAPLGSVIILSAEDEVADTIRPRAEVAGADLDRVHVVTAVKLAQGGGERMFDLTQDIERLERKIRELGDVALIVIDPFSAYMGKPGKLDTFRSTDVRATLAPLQQMAARLDVAMVGIGHLNKSGSMSALMRVLDSVAFVAAARGVYVIVRDPDDDERRLFLPAKNNIGKIRTGLSFRVVEKIAPIGDPYPAIEWDDVVVSITADEALAWKPDGRKSEAAEKAKVLLLEVLAKGPVLQKEVQAKAAEQQISAKSLRTAKEALSVVSTKIGLVWWWTLPGQPAPM